jgi:hypothetical protein
MKIRKRLLTAFLATLCVAGAAHAETASGTAAPRGCFVADQDGSSHDGAHDFDFLSGRNWKNKTKKRIGRFINSTKFEEPEGFEFSERVPGVGMVEQVTYPSWRPNWKLVIVRLYDQKTHKWYIYDMHDPTHISPPLAGSFHNGLGIFEGDDHIDNQDVKVRYIWTCDWEHPRFQQEMSNDGGKTWEIDWTMEFTEVKPGQA